jgi:hypothetical protein
MELVVLQPVAVINKQVACHLHHFMDVAFTAAKPRPTSKGVDFLLPLHQLQQSWCGLSTMAASLQCTDCQCIA